MTPRISITESDLLDAWLAANTREGPEGAKTAREIADDLSWPLSRVGAYLRALHGTGRLTSHRVRRAGVDGRNALVPAYTIRPER